MVYNGKWLVYNGTCYSNRWFRCTPIYGTPHIISRANPLAVAGSWCCRFVSASLLSARCCLAMRCQLSRRNFLGNYGGFPEDLGNSYGFFTGKSPFSMGFIMVFYGIFMNPGGVIWDLSWSIGIYHGIIWAFLWDLCGMKIFFVNMAMLRLTLLSDALWGEVTKKTAEFGMSTELVGKCRQILWVP